jgi:hypothetical protein
MPIYNDNNPEKKRGGDSLADRIIIAAAIIWAAIWAAALSIGHDNMEAQDDNRTDL